MARLRLSSVLSETEIEGVCRLLDQQSRTLGDNARRSLYAVVTNHIDELVFHTPWPLPDHPQIVEVACSYCAGLGCMSCDREGVQYTWCPVDDDVLDRVRMELIEILRDLL